MFRKLMVEAVCLAAVAAAGIAFSGVPTLAAPIKKVPVDKVTIVRNRVFTSVNMTVDTSVVSKVDDHGKKHLHFIQTKIDKTVSSKINTERPAPKPKGPSAN